MAKKFRKVFGETPEEVVVLRTKVFFDADGIGEVEDDEVADVLTRIPGYEFVSGDQEDPKGEETPEKPSESPENDTPDEDPPADENPADESTSEEDSEEDEDEDSTSEEDSEEEEDEEKVAPKPIKPRAPRKPKPRG
jgi:hypothetical protein